MMQDGDKPGEPRAPEGLARELRTVYRGRLEVPEGVDRAMLELAATRAELARTGRVRRLRLAGWWAAAAAGVGVAAVVALRPGAPAGAGGSRVAGGAGVAEDLNGDGVVDILDALILARRVEGGAAPAEWDFNGDGAVDRKDVDVVAAAAVRLKGRV